MAEKRAPEFNPEKSRRARELLAMSSKELFERYFVKSTRGKVWLPDFNDELNKLTANNDYLYPYTTALVGRPLEYIPSLVNLKFSAYIPEGYKFNGPALVKDMEAMLRENPAQARRSAAQVNSTAFIIEMGDFFIDRINHGLDYSLEY